MPAFSLGRAERTLQSLLQPVTHGCIGTLAVFGIVEAVPGSPSGEASHGPFWRCWLWVSKDVYFTLSCASLPIR
jgi:hypothetical protein